eukprot:CAMPEP_0113675280 /NCGR_PEP_ID=MMETSP0038_2-20120614/7921_1 /TAXON_ID=2898 /ORGANISM="Cryptomonas paramecium" /LENGTH=128 /DNA_ID=CAMNT_0000592023 /DNA_START=451 /DNA_END=834 /DNA_ORIENTATION=+ /assembly_acc=CAM_ASM_000170
MVNEHPLRGAGCSSGPFEKPPNHPPAFTCSFARCNAAPASLDPPAPNQISSPHQVPAPHTPCGPATPPQRARAPWGWEQPTRSAHQWAVPCYATGHHARHAPAHQTSSATWPAPGSPAPTAAPHGPAH